MCADQHNRQSRVKQQKQLSRVIFSERQPGFSELRLRGGAGDGPGLGAGGERRGGHAPAEHVHDPRGGHAPDVRRVLVPGAPGVKRPGQAET